MVERQSESDHFQGRACAATGQDQSCGYEAVTTGDSPTQLASVKQGFRTRSTRLVATTRRSSELLSGFGVRVPDGAPTPARTPPGRRLTRRRDGAPAPPGGPTPCS